MPIKWVKRITQYAGALQVAGNLHFAPGKSFQQGAMHVHDLVPFPDKNFDLSHTIKSLSFGQPYPGMHNPLDGNSVNQTVSPQSGGSTGMWQYFLKVLDFHVCVRKCNCSGSCMKPAAGILDCSLSEPYRAPAP